MPALALSLLMLLLAVIPAGAQDPAAIQRHRQRMLELFHSLDLDGDGRLSTKDVGPHPRLRNLDRDGDGVRPITIHKIPKKAEAKYDKGAVQPDGRIVPFVI